jgi:hypothetical protein
MAGLVLIGGDMSNLLDRWARAIVEGQAPDPRTRQGVILYSLIGIGVGWFLGMHGVL